MDVDVVELTADQTEDDHVKPLVEGLAAWKELVKLALELNAVFHGRGNDRHHVTT